MNKLVTFYSDSHESMYNDYFINSFNEFLSKKYELKSKKISQISPTGEYQSPGFDFVMLEKIKWIIENIDITDNNFLVYADCDIQFFGDLEINLGDKDILFQHDFFPNNYCAGFFICKQNEKVLNFFRLVEKTLIASMDGKIHDQTIINKLFREGCRVVNQGMLPSNKYWTAAFSTNGMPWKGQSILPPQEILMHHANFVVGIENKLRLLETIKQNKNGIRN